MNNYAKLTDVTQNHEVYEPDEGGLNLGALIEILWRNIPLITCITATFSCLAFFRAATQTPIYQSSFEILSEPVTIETKVSSSGSASRETTEEITAVKLDEVQIKTLRSPKIINPVVEQLQERFPAVNYSSIVSNLALNPINDDQTVLEVLYQHPNKELVESVVSLLSKTYIDYSSERRLSGVNRGLKFLEQQIPKLQERIDLLNLELQQIRKEYNFIEPKIQAEQLSSRLESSVQQQLNNESELNKQRWNLGVIKQEAEQEPSSQVNTIELGTDRYLKLLENLREIDRQIANKSAIFTDNSLEVQILREEKEKIVSLLEREKIVVEQKLGSQINSLKQQDRTVDREIENLKTEINEWSAVTQKYDEIQRQINIAVSQLNELLIQREVLKIEFSQKEAPWRLLTDVQEPYTNIASKVNHVILGTLLGSLVGVGVAFALDKYQNRVYTSAQLQETTNFPILGIIPFDRSLSKFSLTQKLFQLIEPNSRTSEIEIYRNGHLSSNLEASSTEAYWFCGGNLGLFEATNSLHSLIVTSATPGEGKSTVGFNLAKVTAGLGKRVLIVDTDLRNISSISVSVSAIPTENLGLTDLLQNSNLQLHRVIRQSSLEENLYILPNGYKASISDPSKLLLSSRMSELMQTAKQNFDLVIYDVPSIVNYADASFLGRKTQGIVLVAGMGKLQNSKLKDAMRKINLSNIPVIGVVVNQSY